MNELINFLQANFVTLTIFLAGTGATVSAYLYNTRHYRYGYQTGKKVVTIYPSPLHPQKSMQEQVDLVKGYKDQVFQMGLSEYTKDYNQEVSRLEQQINSLKEEERLKKEMTKKRYEDEDKKLEGGINELDGGLKAKETELFQLKKVEDEKNEVLEQSSKTRGQNTYFFSSLIQEVRESFSKATQKLETDLLRYIYVIVITLLLIGDYYITFFIFNDILKIQFKDNKLSIYIFSGIIALVFLVLILVFVLL